VYECNDRGLLIADHLQAAALVAATLALWLAQQWKHGWQSMC